MCYRACFQYQGLIHKFQGFDIMGYVAEPRKMEGNDRFFFNHAQCQVENILAFWLQLRGGRYS